MNKTALRTTMKAQRLALSPEQQEAHARAVMSQLCIQEFFYSAKTLALYLPVNGELDTGKIANEARKAGKKLYLPVLSPEDHEHLCFMPFETETKFKSNRFSIPEPEFNAETCIAVQDLDLVLVPLVLFDSHCHRIGMGAGFYDRTFAFLRHQPRPARPFLCGLAHDFQHIKNTEPQSWDVQLDAVITDLNLFFCDAD